MKTRLRMWPRRGKAIDRTEQETGTIRELDMTQDEEVKSFMLTTVGRTHRNEPRAPFEGIEKTRLTNRDRSRNMQYYVDASYV